MIKKERNRLILIKDSAKLEMSFRIVKIRNKELNLG